MRSKAVSEAVSRGAFSGAKLSLFRYFLLLLLETILGFRVYMVMGFQFLNQILMRQVSSHRCDRRCCYPATPSDALHHMCLQYTLQHLHPHSDEYHDGSLSAEFLAVIAIIVSGI
jgi:hypothetical protein